MGVMPVLVVQRAYRTWLGHKIQQSDLFGDNNATVRRKLCVREVSFDKPAVAVCTEMLLDQRAEEITVLLYGFFSP